MYIHICTYIYVHIYIYINICMIYIPNSPQCGFTSPFSGPYFVLALVGICRRVVYIKAIETDDLAQI